MRGSFNSEHRVVSSATRAISSRCFVSQIKTSVSKILNILSFPKIRFVVRNHVQYFHYGFLTDGEQSVNPTPAVGRQLGGFANVDLNTAVWKICLPSISNDPVRWV